MNEHDTRTPARELPAEIRRLLDEIGAVDAHARRVVEGLSEEQGTAAPAPGAWSVSECFDHLAITNAAYVEAMGEAAAAARRAGRMRTGPALPGLVGRAFIWTMEPRSGGRFRMKSPGGMRPAPKPLAETWAAFTAAEEGLRRFLEANADLELGRIRFPNPFVRGIRFSLATGAHVIPAHNRRHVLQAERARGAVEGTRS